MNPFVFLSAIPSVPSLSQPFFPLNFLSLALAPSECITSTFTSNDSRAGSSYIVKYSQSGGLWKPPQQHDKSEIIHNKRSGRFNRGEFCRKRLFWVFQSRTGNASTQKYLSGTPPHAYLLSTQTTILQTVQSFMKSSRIKVTCILNNAEFRVVLLENCI